MRSLEDAQKNWAHLEKVATLSELKSIVSSQNDPQITSGLRSVCWKAFFQFKTLDRETWSSSLAESRAAYDSLRSHLLRAIEYPDDIESAVDPLSENEESPWVALRNDETLRAEIFQDVERCMPDSVYFRQPSTQNMMLDILFIFCKLNKDIGYRQGMHEVLAPILWVVEREAIDPRGVSAGGRTGTTELVLSDVLDASFVEHDSFTLFALIMQTAKFFYAPGEAGQSAATTAHNDSPMLARSRRIFEEFLPKVDPALAKHLVKIDIVPQIFLMRWIRLLFGREFSFDDVLIIWDILFAEDPSLELIDLICIAMLLRIRWELVEADTNSAFTALLKYPEPSDPPFTFVHDAIFLRGHLNPQGGADIIAKYGKKAPPIVEISHQQGPSPSAFGSTRGHIAQPGGLEALIQDAAKNVYDRGEKWGVTKAFRDAVGGVKKNVQAFQSGQGTPRAGGREYRRPARVPAATKPVASPSDVLKRVSALEARNKSLGKMLGSALSELWDYHKERSEDSAPDKQLMESLSLAIAKVQFVQVYLEDSTIPLPAEEPAINKKEAMRISPPERTSSAPALTSPGAANEADRATLLASSAQQRLKANPSTDRTSSPHPSSNTSESPRTDHSHVSPSAPSPAAAKPHALSVSPRSRPSLAQSSFSWMLGQDERTSAFASASAHTAFPSDEKRRIARAKDSSTGKGYLFGDEDEEAGSSMRDNRSRQKASRSEQEVDEEIIDLGPLGKSAVS